MTPLEEHTELIAEQLREDGFTIDSTEGGVIHCTDPDGVDHAIRVELVTDDSRD